MAEFNTREVLGIMRQMDKRPQNQITLKVTGLILSERSWETKDGKKGYTYMLYSEAADGVITFNSSRLLPKGKPAEVLLTLDGFRAFERAR